MFNLEILGPLAQDLHAELKTLFYILLPAFFALSLVFNWFKSPAGGPDFVDSLKRVFIASLLMAGFQEIVDVILSLTTGLAVKIGDMQSLDNYLQMIADKSKSYPTSPMGALLAVDDFILSVLSYLSYLLVYLARMLMVAIYHFTWMFLIILSRILLSFHVFTSRITINLFRSLLEVASWQIVWAVLATMLKALPFGDVSLVEDGHITLLLLNFIIAISLLLTPFLVKALVGGSVSAVAGSLLPIMTTTLIAAPSKMAGAFRAAQGASRELRDTTKYLNQRLDTARAVARVSPHEIKNAVDEHRLRPGPRKLRSPSGAPATDDNL